MSGKNASLTRKQLSNSFQQGAQPSATDFANFIDSVLVPADDGIHKSKDKPLTIEVAPVGDTRPALSINTARETPAWTVAVATDKHNLTIADAPNAPRLTIEQGTGKVTIGCAGSAGALEVTGLIRASSGGANAGIQFGGADSNAPTGWLRFDANAKRLELGVSDKTMNPTVSRKLVIDAGTAADQFGIYGGDDGRTPLLVVDKAGDTYVKNRIVFSNIDIPKSSKNIHNGIHIYNENNTSKNEWGFVVLSNKNMSPMEKRNRDNRLKQKYISNNITINEAELDIGILNKNSSSIIKINDTAGIIRFYNKKNNVESDLFTVEAQRGDAWVKGALHIGENIVLSQDHINLKQSNITMRFRTRVTNLALYEVVAIGAEGQCFKTDRPNNPNVVGVIAWISGVSVGGLREVDVAVAGMIKCKVRGFACDPTGLDIKKKIFPGDTLTTSKVKGVAQLVAYAAGRQSKQPLDRFPGLVATPGAILGKALDSVDEGTVKEINVLVTL
jgi:hypothetical protein